MNKSIANKDIAKLYKVRDIAYHLEAVQVLDQFSFFDFLYGIKNIQWRVNNHLFNSIHGPWTPYLMKSINPSSTYPEYEIKWTGNVPSKFSEHQLINMPLRI